MQKNNKQKRKVNRKRLTAGIIAIICALGMIIPSVAESVISIQNSAVSYKISTASDAVKK